MRLTINITKIPGGFPLSYPPNRWGKFGWIQWLYGGFAGPTHWINSEHSCFEPEYNCPDYFRYWIAPGCIGDYSVIPRVNSDLPGIKVAGNALNPATGVGFPIQGVL